MTASATCAAIYGNVSALQPTRKHSDMQSDHPEASDSDYAFSEQVGHLLRKAYQRHVAIFQRNTCDPQLTGVQFVTLCAVRDRGPSSLNELVQATAVDQATIRGIVERLKARDLITLSSDPNDKRKVVVNLTASGRQMVEDMVPHAKRISELTMAGLNPAERVAMLFLLRKMNEQESVE
jgi:MarR family transcriptional regulator, lower aerobic nicotinate degradation pathway regulator